mgnify:FL=1
MRLIIQFTLSLLLTGFLLPSAAEESRFFEFSYQLIPSELPLDKQIDVYLPLPAEQVGQTVLEESLTSSFAGRKGVEKRYENGFYHVTRPANSNAPITAKLTWTVSRKILRANNEATLTEAEKALFLNSNTLVPVGHEVLKPILQEIHQLRANDSPAATARAIYDWVVDNVEYKKVGSGWGNGDTFWACSERYGNCTDFHALFIALARSEGIPARFEIGFPVPLSRVAGDIGGYHCWVQFYLPEQGWIPIDASEAAKNPDKRALFYGTHPADRIHFSTGRDLVVSEASEEDPLNYFIYPYVEVDGIPWQGKLKTKFSYREVNAPRVAD